MENIKRLQRFNQVEDLETKRKKIQLRIIYYLLYFYLYHKVMMKIMIY